MHLINGGGGGGLVLVFSIFVDVVTIFSSSRMQHLRWSSL